MKVLAVHYCGWGEDWPLGRLADDGSMLLFEYSAEALAQELELSPLHLKLRAQAYGGFPDFLSRLPGLIADALPDGWGMLLMDRLFRQQGIRHPGPLDRLAFIGDRALGALRFAPPTDLGTPEPNWNLLALAQESARVLAGEGSDVLRELVLTGGSPQGARPKALLRYDPSTGAVTTANDASGAPWLAKFPANGEHKEVCAIEHLYTALAQACGLQTPECAYFDLGPKHAAFALARFDRDANKRVPIHSLAGLLHADFRQPGSVDYGAFLRATRALTRDQREVQKGYERAVFNAIFHIRDDHPKNLAYRLGPDRRWRLAPAYDLNFSDGPRGEHSMDYAGEGARVRREHLLRLATDSGVAQTTALETIDRIASVAADFAQRATEYPIRRATVRHIAAVIAQCRELALFG